VQKSTDPLFLPLYGPWAFCAFLLNIAWAFCAFLLKKHASCRFFFSVGSCCSRSECYKRKAIWDACVAEIKQDPVLKKDFDTQMLAVMDQIGQYIQTD
jgi:hypothetical protein